MQVTAGRYFCEPPMKAKNCGVGSPFPSEKMFCPVSASITDWWMCMAEPGSRDMGLAMNVAYMLCRSAASRIVRLKRNTWSASASGSPCRRLISICAAPSSWISVSISRPCASEKSYMSSNRSSNSLTAAIE